MTDPVACAPSYVVRTSHLKKVELNYSLQYSPSSPSVLLYSIIIWKKEVLTVLQSSDIRILGLKFGRMGGFVRLRANWNKAILFEKIVLIISLFYFYAILKENQKN